MLQRPVVVKIASVEYIPAYRAALRSTAQFAHPNMIGFYDLIVEPNALYIVQEYVDGADFKTLLQTQLAPYQVADIGAQICQALLYAGTPPRKVCHGDLTPSAILCDRYGLVRINNFALPSDMSYFRAWSVVGGGDAALSDPHLSPGQMSDGRKEDDTRAVGLLLYQLLTRRSADATSVEPPADGRLCFMSHVPPELCELTARAMVRMHPQHIKTPEQLYTELKGLTEAFELASPPVVAAEPIYPAEDFARVRQHSLLPSSGLPSPMPILMHENTMEEGFGLRKAVVSPMITTEAIPPSLPSMPMQLVVARQAAYASLPKINQRPQHINVSVLLLIGFVLFAFFFGLGWLVAHVIFQ
jgi:serine/threonine protein kinase